MPRKVQYVYLGIDPGRSGGLAAVGPLPGQVRAVKTPLDEEELWDWISGYGRHGNILTPTPVPVWLPGTQPIVRVLAAVEQQTPRPTYWRDKRSGKSMSSILSSTVKLYGSYMQARSFLVAASIDFLVYSPKLWQGHLRIPPRLKSESESRWKGRLKNHAQRLYPSTRVTLYTADALLLAECARRSREDSEDE